MCHGRMGITKLGGTMKGFIFTTLILIAVFTMGVKSCSQDDQVLATQLALATVQTGMVWADTTIQKKCAAGQWKPEDCAQWQSQSPMVKEVLNNIIPWAIKKLMETTTEEERQELIDSVK